MINNFILLNLFLALCGKLVLKTICCVFIIIILYKIRKQIRNKNLKFRKGTSVTTAGTSVTERNNFFLS